MRQVRATLDRRVTWKTRAIRKTNRFDPATFCIGVRVKWYERSRLTTGKVYKVFLSGTLKPPATNRGVSHGIRQWKIPCPKCQRTNNPTYFDAVGGSTWMVCPSCPHAWKI